VRIRGEEAEEEDAAAGVAQAHDSRAGETPLSVVTSAVFGSVGPVVPVKAESTGRGHNGI
jgi:hypothetical protein